MGLNNSMEEFKLENYWDSAATSRIYPEVLEIIQDILTNHWGNPATLYAFGQDASKLQEFARATIAKLINAEPDEIIFVSCASEANALAIHQRRRCFCSPFCHHDILENKKATIVEDNFLKRLVKMREEIALDDLYIEDMYACSYVGNETGEIYPIEDQIEYAHQMGMLALVDCTQAAGNIAVDIKELNCDFASFSSHKIHGPKYCGWLYVRKELLPELKPLIYGSQEHSIRGGTSNTAFNIASAVAFKMSVDNMQAKQIHCAQLRRCIIDKLREAQIDFKVIEGKEQIPSTLCLVFANITGEVIMSLLSDKGIYVGTGAACNTGNMEPSLTLQTMGVDEKYLQGQIRISMSQDNTIESAQVLADSIIEIIKG